jgi:uncharacterized membrane protein YdjX (TVP38/TMEM64 family)
MRARPRQKDGSTVIPLTERQKETTIAESRGDGARSRFRRFLPVIVIAAGLGLGYLFGLHRYFTLDILVSNRDSLKAYVESHYLLAGGLYFAIYTVAVAFAFPAASLLTILGGFLFGWFVAGTLTAFSATIGATLLFMAARTAFGDVLKRKAGPAVSRIAGSFEDNAFGYLLVLRLAPIFPFLAVNIAPAFFNVSLRTYVIATFVGILPGTYAYAYLGEGLDSVVRSVSAAGETLTLSDIVTPELKIAFLVLAVVAAVPLVVKRLWKRGQA